MDYDAFELSAAFAGEYYYGMELAPGARVRLRLKARLRRLTRKKSAEVVMVNLVRPLVEELCYPHIPLQRKDEKVVGELLEGFGLHVSELHFEYTGMRDGTYDPYDTWRVAATIE